jgi:hypothetical protein
MGAKHPYCAWRLLSNALYNKAKESFLSQNPSIDMDTDTIKVALVDTGTYTFSAAHQYYSSVSSSVVGTPVALANKTVTSGVFDADDAVFSAVTGVSIEAYVVYKDTGSAATSPLIAYFDTASAGLPVTPNNGTITITFNASGIFAL